MRAPAPPSSPPLQTWNESFVALHSPELQVLRREHGWDRALRALGAAFRRPDAKRVTTWIEWRCMVVDLGLVSHSSTIVHHEVLFVEAVRELHERRRVRSGGAAAAGSAKVEAAGKATLRAEDVPLMFGILALAIVKWDAPPFAKIGRYRHRQLALLAFKSLIASLGGRLAAYRDRRSRQQHRDAGGTVVTVTQTLERLTIQMYRRDGKVLLDYEKEIAGLVVAEAAEPARVSPTSSPRAAASAATRAQSPRRRATTPTPSSPRLTAFSPPKQLQAEGSERTFHRHSRSHHSHSRSRGAAKLARTAAPATATARHVSDIYLRLDALRAERVQCGAAFEALNEGSIAPALWRSQFAAIERRLKAVRGMIKKTLLPFGGGELQRNAGGGLTALQLEWGSAYLLHARVYATRTLLVRAKSKSKTKRERAGVAAAARSRRERLGLLLDRADRCFENALDDSPHLAAPRIYTAQVRIARAVLLLNSGSAGNGGHGVDGALAHAHSLSFSPAEVEEEADCVEKLLRGAMRSMHNDVRGGSPLATRVWINAAVQYVLHPLLGGHDAILIIMRGCVWEEGGDEHDLNHEDLNVLRDRLALSPVDDVEFEDITVRFCCGGEELSLDGLRMYLVWLADVQPQPCLDLLGDLEILPRIVERPAGTLGLRPINPDLLIAIEDEKAKEQQELVAIEEAKEQEQLLLLLAAEEMKETSPRELRRGSNHDPAAAAQAARGVAERGLTVQVESDAGDTGSDVGAAISALSPAVRRLSGVALISPVAAALRRISGATRRTSLASRSPTPEMLGPSTGSPRVSPPGSGSNSPVTRMDEVDAEGETQSIGSVDYFFAIGARASTWEVPDDDDDHDDAEGESSSAASKLKAKATNDDDGKTAIERVEARLKALDLQPGITSRYPTTDYTNSMLPVDDGLAAFVFPLGFEARLFPHDAPPPQPLLYTSVLTDEKRERHYLSILCEWEDVDRMQLAKKAGAVGGSDLFAGVDLLRTRICTPKAMCTVSRWPFFSLFNTFLVTLRRVIDQGTKRRSPLPPLPLERFVENFVLKTQLPTPGDMGSRYLIADRSVTFQRPREGGMPLLGVDLSLLFKILDLDGVLLVIRCMLCERKIVLTCSSIEVLTPCVEGLLSLLYPFQWQCPCIPLMPAPMKRMITAYARGPVPIMFGMHESFRPTSRSGLKSLAEMCCVDLDNGTVEAPAVAVPDFARKVVASLTATLQQSPSGRLALTPAEGYAVTQSSGEDSSSAIDEKSSSSGFADSAAAAKKKKKRKKSRGLVELIPSSIAQLEKDLAKPISRFASTDGLSVAHDPSASSAGSKQSGPIHDGQALFNDRLVREQFIVLLARTLGDFRPYIKGRQQKQRQTGNIFAGKRTRRRSSVVELFDRTRFLNEASRDGNDFLIAMTETQMFQAFLEKYSVAHDLLPLELQCFERVIEARKLRKRSAFGQTSYPMFPTVERSGDLFMTPAPSERGIAHGDVRRFKWLQMPNFEKSKWVENDYVDGSWKSAHAAGRDARQSHEEMTEACRAIIIDIVHEVQRVSECRRADFANEEKEAALRERDALLKQLEKLRNANLGATLQKEQRRSQRLGRDALSKFSRSGR